jgi:predicted P-loop ATPase
MSEEQEKPFIRSVGADGREGPPHPIPENVWIALDRLGIKLSHDTFADRYCITGFDGYGPQLTDEAIAALRITMHVRYRFKLAKDYFYDIIIQVARSNAYHPLLDYLKDKQEKWDGVDRLNTWMTTYAGAEDNAFNRAVGRILLVAAVRRARQPGCKYDEMPVWESAQGTLKSSLFKALAVKPEWFTDRLPLTADTKVVIEQTRGRWVVEIADMHGMKKADVDAVKSFLSCTEDSARGAYGRVRQDVPRAFICVGTVNPGVTGAYLKDPTGNRRFWPVRVGVIDLASLVRDRDQLWGEAAVLEARGESIRLDRSLWEAAGAVQAARQERNAFIDILDKALGGREGKIRKADVYQLCDLKGSQLWQGNQELVAAAMAALGWTATRLRIGGNKCSAFAKGTEPHKPLYSTRDKNENVYVVVEGDNEALEPPVHPSGAPAAAVHPSGMKMGPDETPKDFVERALKVAQSLASAPVHPPAEKK